MRRWHILWILLAACVIPLAFEAWRRQQDGEASAPTARIAVASVTAEQPRQPVAAPSGAFEETYGLWKEHCAQVAGAPDLATRFDSPHYRRIVDMGPAVLPLLVAKIREDDGFQWAAWAWGAIARVMPNGDVYPWHEESAAEWWAGGQELANERFRGLYAKLQECRDSGDEQGARAARDTMWAMGLVALPPLMEEIRSGDNELADVVARIMGRSADIKGQTPAARASSCLNWWDQNKQDWTIPFEK